LLRHFDPFTRTGSQPPITFGVPGLARQCPLGTEILVWIEPDCSPLRSVPTWWSKIARTVCFRISGECLLSVSMPRPSIFGEGRGGSQVTPYDAEKVSLPRQLNS
jgi:hypothetical protein